MAEETWRAVRGILEDPARKPPRGVRTLLSGLACCPCGNVATGMPSHTGHHIYRCAPPGRDREYAGGHVARQAAPVEDFIERAVIARLSAPDAADLVAVPDGGRMWRGCGRRRRRSGPGWRRRPGTGRWG